MGVRTLGHSGNGLERLLFVLFAALATVQCAQRRDTTPLSLMFISIDTLRADHLGCFGYPRQTSPHIDRLARSGILFSNFFTVSPKTGPSMTTFFTGKYPQNHGVTENPVRVPDGEDLLAEMLPGSFRKAAFVGNPTLSQVRGYHEGFERFALIDQGPEVMADRALEWLDSVGDERFFAWVHFLDPHGPYDPPARLRERFIGDAYYDESKRVALDYKPQPGINPNYILGAVPAYQRLDDVDIVDYYVARYDAEIVWVDEQIGRILDHLDRSGLGDRTLVVVTADHGESLGEHDYYFEHGMLVNEGSIHIPLIIRHPDMRRHVSVDSLAQNTDLLPTLFTQMGLEPPDNIDGVDLSYLLSGAEEKRPARDYIYACTPYPDEYTTFYETVRTTRGKLIRSDTGELWFFDLSRDPQELTNLVRQMDPETRSRWTAILEGFGPRRSLPPMTPVLPEDLRERLESLGYLQ